MTDTAERQDWMGVLAKAPADRLSDVWQAASLSPRFEWLRAPELGTVMVQGRTGGTGAPFNLGEMTVTRCSVRLAEDAGGTVGHAVVSGRDKTKAERAALIDALLQTAAREDILARVIEPLRRSDLAAKAATAAKAQSTKVDFFTLVRGDS